MSKKPIVLTKYDSEDIAEIITNMFLNIETPEGVRFKALQTLPTVVAIRVNNKTFIVNVLEKDSLN